MTGQRGLETAISQLTQVGGFLSESSKGLKFGPKKNTKNRPFWPEIWQTLKGLGKYIQNTFLKITEKKFLTTHKPDIRLY